VIAVSDTIQNEMQDGSISFEGDAASEFEMLAADYLAAKALIVELKQQKERAEKRMREMMGNASSAYVGSKLAATINLRNRSNINREALEAGWPDALKTCLTHTVYTVFDAKE
jgi:hypothetical protein